jgi:phosphatidylglycerol:prolipoprotein diacylglycerol transferase
MHQFDPLYAGLMLIAMLVCSWLLRGTQKALSLTAQQKLGLGVGAFCGAMIGAKLPFVLSDWSGLLSGLAWLSDGKTIVLGLVGGYFGVEVAKWALDVRIKVGDSFAVPVAVAVAIGRLACFEAGCCYGVPTSMPWGVAFPTALDDPAAWRHPTQLYESTFHFSSAVVLLLLSRRELFQGQLIKLYILAYLATGSYLKPFARSRGCGGV